MIEELRSVGSGHTIEEENEEFLRCLVEECCEVGQRVVKAERFGLKQRQSGHELDNSQRVVEELHDLISVAIILEARGVLSGVLPSEDVVRAKRRKILRYMSVKLTGEDPRPESAEPLSDKELKWIFDPTGSTGREWTGVDPRTGRVAKKTGRLPICDCARCHGTGQIELSENLHESGGVVPCSCVAASLRRSGRKVPE